MFDNYDDYLWAELNPYLAWIRENEVDDSVTEELDFVIYAGTEGRLSGIAAKEFKSFFDANPQIDIAYADEDYLDENGNRCNPWFKPDFSPDTLESFFYYGNVVAVRKSLIEQYKDMQYSQYDIALSEAKKGNKSGHIAKVLYTNNKYNENDMIVSDNDINVKADNITVIIPSKDNSRMLKTCINSFIEHISDKKTTDMFDSLNKTQSNNVHTVVDLSNIEFIIVDNGSSNEEKMCITEYFSELLGKHIDLKIKYIYEPMDFNFSKMCNLGASKANGKYLLFLNDDIEIINSDWLDNMLYHANKKHVGAVGAKLLYPNGLIQHVGITNMGIGPAHKLNGRKDMGSIYHGHNILDYNMLAVTAACLLVRKDVFDKVNGFDESLAVAYNDVELCMRIYKAGFYNVQCNKAVLVHHESVTRGQDTSREKKLRLAKEKATLYEKHPDLYGKDPFYSENLVQWRKDVDYAVNLIFPCERAVQIDEYVGRLPREHKNKFIRKLTGENRLMVSIDSVEHEIYEQQLIIRGWFVVRGQDNDQIKRELVLKDVDTGKVYKTELRPAYRPDVKSLFEANSDGTRKVCLSGIHVVINLKKNEVASLSEHTLQIGVIANQKIKWEETLWNQMK